jgi:hypothetical protein
MHSSSNEDFGLLFDITSGMNDKTLADLFIGPASFPQFMRIRGSM